MRKNILTIPFEPEMEVMTEILLKRGFRPMNNTTPDDLPTGAVVLIYDKNNHSMGTIIIGEYSHRGFYYTHFNDLNKAFNPLHVDTEYHNYYFKNLLYRVLGHLPEFTTNPSDELAGNLLESLSFKSLAEATPEDLPQGCIALVSNQDNKITPVIVRVLSMNNRRFLYLCQNHIVAGQWDSQVIMDGVCQNSFENYRYLVIS